VDERPASESESREIAHARAGGGPRLARSARQLIGVRVDGATIAHVSALLGALFIVAGAGYLFKAWNLLTPPRARCSGLVHDVHVRLPLFGFSWRSPSSSCGAHLQTLCGGDGSSGRL